MAMIKRWVFAFLLVCFLQQLWAQPGTPVQLPGTKFTMIPPSGFAQATAFTGFQEERTGAVIMVNGLPAPYAATADAFTEEGLRSQGMALVSKEQVEIGQSEGVLLTVTQAANGTKYKKYILIFGYEDGTCLVTGMFPEKAANLSEPVRTAMLSVAFHADQDDNPLDAVPFIVDVTGTGFKLAKYAGGMLMYSTDGRVPTDKPALLVGNSLAAVPVGDRKQYTTERLRKLPGAAAAAVKETRALTIDGLDGYEVIAESGTEGGTKEMISLTMLFDDAGGYYMLVGMTKEDIGAYVDIFRKIALTFRRK